MDPTSGLSASTASLAASLGEAGGSATETAKAVAVLKAANEAQASLLALVMQALGVGQNVDVQA